MKTGVFLYATLCCAITVFTACNNRASFAPDDKAEFVINLDSVVIRPYLGFGSSLTGVREYIERYYPGYTTSDGDSLEAIKQIGGTIYRKLYKNGKSELSFYFIDKDGNNLTLCSYDYFFPMSLEPVKAQLLSNGFSYKGTISYEDFNSDITYLYLSADNELEVQLSYWYKDGGIWAISFQPTDENDLKIVQGK
jgi:hypothetical protein